MLDGLVLDEDELIDELVDFVEVELDAVELDVVTVDDSIVLASEMQARAIKVELAVRMKFGHHW